MRPAIFLDRDGVVIENRPTYVRRWEDVEIFPAAVKILSRIASFPYQIVFVTNQSVVGRGIISIDAAQEINRRLLYKLGKQGCRIDGVFMCPHAPDDRCSCRKPFPGLLFQAASALKIDLVNSMMIGDAWTDLQAGHSAGVAQVALVLTGRGRQQLDELERPPELTDISMHNDLAAALESLVPSRYW